MKVFRLAFVLVTFFCPSLSNECDAVRCRREGSSGKMRIGHRPLMYQEMPYLVVFIYEGSPFCFGVLIKGATIENRGKLYRHVVLTSCTCGRLYARKNYEMGVGTIRNKYLRIDRLVKIKYSLVNFMGCANSEDIYARGGEDFAYAFNSDPAELDRLSPKIEYAPFKSKDTSVITEHINSMLENHESRCFGVGFGGYDFTHEPPTNYTLVPPQYEGKKGNLVHIYDYRLITDEECDRYMPKCCRSWGSLLVKGGIKSTGLHCAIRGKERSLCFGNMGSPIVCDGYLIGFFKGHMKCSPDDKNYAGPDIFIPLSHHMQWIMDKIQLELPFVYDRPLSEPFPDHEESNKIDDIFPRQGGGKGESGSGRGAGNEGGKGGKKKPGDDDDDDYDYYGEGCKDFPNIILTILNIWYSIA